jgi:Tfp pilus assembly protein PilF
MAGPMRKAGWILLLAAGVAGCTPTSQERAREYNEDGVYLFRRGDYRSARDSFEAALKLTPEDADLLYNLGQCYDRSGDAAKAEQHYRACLRTMSNHADCRHALANLWLREGRGADAKRMVEDWLAREPKLAAAYAEDGWLWFQSGDLPRAQARLQQALELDPQDRRALTELARVYEAIERPDRSVALYERILQREPDQAAIRRRLHELQARGVTRPRPD